MAINYYSDGTNGGGGVLWRVSLFLMQKEEIRGKGHKNFTGPAELVVLKGLDPEGNLGQDAHVESIARWVIINFMNFKQIPWTEYKDKMTRRLRRGSRLKSKNIHQT